LTTEFVKPTAYENFAVALHNADAHGAVRRSLKCRICAAVGIEPSNIRNWMAGEFSEKTGNKNAPVRLHHKSVKAMAGRSGVKTGIQQTAAIQASEGCVRLTCNIVKVAANEHFAITLKRKRFEFFDRRRMEALV
jgi:hypothetical protein